MSTIQKIENRNDSDQILSTAMSGDGRVMAVIDNSELQVWEYNESHVLWKLRRIDDTLQSKIENGITTFTEGKYNDMNNQERIALSLLSLSRDGKTLIVGLPGDDVIVCTFESDSYTSSVTMTAPENKFQRIDLVDLYTVCISRDGSTVAVGHRGGYVRIYEYNDNNVFTMTETVVPDIDTTEQINRVNICLSSTGDSVIIGIPEYNYVGVWFKNNDNDWVKRGREWSDEDSSVRYGQSVSLSGDGLIAAFSMIYSTDYYDQYERGRVQIWEYVDGEWGQKGTDCVGTVGYYGSKLGHAVSLSENGRTLAVSAPVYSESYDTYNGRVYVWDFDASGGRLLRRVNLRGHYYDSLFGSFLSLSADGSGMVVASVNGQMNVYSLPCSRTDASCFRNTNTYQLLTGTLSDVVMDTIELEAGDVISRMDNLIVSLVDPVPRFGDFLHYLRAHSDDDFSSRVRMLVRYENGYVYSSEYYRLRAQVRKIIQDVLYTDTNVLDAMDQFRNLTPSSLPLQEDTDSQQPSSYVPIILSSVIIILLMGIMFMLISQSSSNNK